MKKKIKGFTLVELIVVLAIIVVLAGVLIPSASYFIRQSKLKTANAQAKIVFNASLTVSQEFEAKNLNILDIKNGDGSIASLPASYDFSNISSYGVLDAIANELVERVNNKVMEVPESDRDVWAVRYEKKTGSLYPVLTGASYSSTDVDRYVGGYPVNTPSSGFSGTYQPLSSATLDYWLDYSSGVTP